MTSRTVWYNPIGCAVVVATALGITYLMPGTDNDPSGNGPFLQAENPRL